MKYLLLILFLALATMPAFAQMGPPTKAKCEVKLVNSQDQNIEKTYKGVIDRDEGLTINDQILFFPHGGYTPGIDVKLYINFYRGSFSLYVTDPQTGHRFIINNGAYKDRKGIIYGGTDLQDGGRMDVICRIGIKPN